MNALISLKLDGSPQLAMARQVQRHPVRGTVDHVDFVVVRRDEVVAAEVPIRLEGEPTELHRNEGLMEQQLFMLTVHATPADIPAAIEVDVSALTIGDAIRVGDLTLPERVTTDVDPEEPVVAGQASRVAADIEAEEAEAEAAAAEVAEVAGEETAEAQGAAEEPASAGAETGAGSQEG